VVSVIVVLLDVDVFVPQSNGPSTVAGGRNPVRGAVKPGMCAGPRVRGTPFGT